MRTCREQRITRRRLLALASLTVLINCGPLQAFANDAFGQALLKGAGSTFVLPLVRQWLTLYRAKPAGAGFSAAGTGLDDDLLSSTALDYEAIGSQAGILRLQAKAVDFAFSELPLSSQALTGRNLIQIPIVSGGIAIVAHLPGLKGALRLDGPTLAAIYRGRISHWNDATIVAQNPDIDLPDSAIIPLHRSEGSGSTYTLTRYLATQDGQWQEVIGVDALARWPGGVAVRGSAGVAQALASTPGSIGYIDAVQAQATGLGIVQLKNSAGFYVAPSAKAIAAAIQAVPWQASQDTQPQFINAPGSDSYPIVTSVLAVLNEHPTSTGDRRARAFLAWALANGQSSANALGYVTLPVSLARQLREQLLAPKLSQNP
jgi:phosphate transport system substrate-binding protein